jgi:hypothetical protein
MIGLALGLAIAAQCPHDPATAAGLLAAEADWVTALESRDVARLGCRLAAEFADSNWRGQRIARADVLTRLPARPDSRLTLSNIETETIGQTGVVRGINTQTGPDGEVIGRVRFTDVFAWRDGRWQAVAAQETLIAE